jgi:hypothetical protein
MSETTVAYHAAAPSQNGQAGYATLDQLRTVAPMAERDLDLAGGVRVRIRQLSRHAQHQINRRAEVGLPGQDLERAEHLTWLFAFVHPPIESEAEAASLFDSLEPSVAQTITDAILELSGLTAAQQTASAAAFQPADAG